MIQIYIPRVRARAPLHHRTTAVAQYGLEQKPRESNATGSPTAHNVVETEAIEGAGR